MRKLLIEVESVEGAEIFTARRMLVGLGVMTSPIIDAGRTEVDPGTETVCGFGPGGEGSINEVTGDLELLR